jgi:hypothetical protein
VLAPVAFEYRPATHLVHDVEATVEALQPCLQGPREKVYTTRCVRCDPSARRGQRLPMEHVVQLLLPLLAEYLPVEHATQLVESDVAA